MLRPCFLVVDREFSSGISSRKLVIETAKFNVITAYSAAEALETLAAYPAVNGAVVDEHVDGIDCPDLVSKLKQIKPGLAVIAVGAHGSCGPADYHVESFSPASLLEVLQRLQPVATATIERTNEALSESETKHS
ncbi:DNA-binding NtrC family response regulator [Granulicella aggregans]|uniref:DNA-binding NtrC family response regulator n=1 Tax=Granulicella aggregans TaxID=474949 RepID=A0A7W7ZEM9_9BACT|nr:response regulator [Granulicella aggregans]MBB5058478.1 DNA-binding NtrC family response regulator [Granulicella aggregans]